jgi:catechol 2,3-dioxygenase-like lactoylglutathione lyase family enzyme
MSSETPPRIEGLCPLIQVFDMPKSLAFYQDLLGFEIVQQAPPGDDCDWAWLRRGGAELMLNTMFEADSRPEAPDAARVLGHSDTSLFIGAPDVEAMYAYLRSHGLDVPPPVVRDYGMKQLCLRDPDGYGICFQWQVAEPGAAPNGGPATPTGNSGFTEGPPSVS